jgi:hypothetical protein
VPGWAGCHRCRLAVSVTPAVDGPGARQQCGCIGAMDGRMLGPGEGARMEIPIADAIAQLRDQLRVCVLEGKDQDICFTPDKIDVELAVTFKAEATGKGEFKLLAFLDLSAEAKASRESQHKIKLSLTVSDKDGKPLKIRSDTVRPDLPRSDRVRPDLPR